MPDWSFYGRDRPLAELRKIISEPRWFFCRVAGRRRIGKTTLLKELAQTETGLSYKLGGKLLYMQVPDSDEKDVAASFRRQLEEFRFLKSRPIFSDSKSRNARYYIADNFLQAWLAVAKPAREAARMKPVDKALSFAIPRLQALEGFAFEKLIRKLHLECSQKGKGDFELTSISLGYWNRARNPDQSIEIDLVALDETSKIIRFGSCKRSESNHDHSALAKFERHIEGFLATKEYRHLQAWKHEKVLFSPSFAKDSRKVLQSSGFDCRDLNDYARLFT